MASLYGTSGAWKEITAQLETYQLKVDHPGEIELLRQNCSAEYERQFEKASQAIETQISVLRQEITQEREKVCLELEKFIAEHALEIKQAEITVDYYRHERSLFNFVRSFFRIQRETGKLEDLQKTLQAHRNTLERELHEKEAQLEQIKTTQDQLAKAACRESNEKVEVLKSLSGSAELATAVAELEMIETLARLPETFQVVNDVHLKAERGLRFEGEWLIRGEISSLVITPAGLFAVEVYRGSKQNAQKPGSSDPREQIKRAAHLCYTFLKPEFPTVTVRSILAYRGHLPENQTTGIVKTLPISEVPGYITWFKENTLDEKQRQEIVEFILEISE